MKHYLVIIFAAVIFIGVMPCRASEIEPRAYTNAPIGINFLIVSYAYSDGGLAISGSSPVKDARLHMNTGILAYACTLDIYGKSGKFDVILPYSGLSGSAMYEGQRHERDISGLHDPLFRFSVNFFGAPALPLEDFMQFQQDLIVGASLQVSAPIGQYDPDKLVNLGTNRWFVKPDIGISKAWGALTLELSTGVFIYSKNDDYNGSKTMEQDPVSSTQAHATYSFGRGIWVAVSGTYDYGGSTTLDGVESADAESNWRTGITLALPVNKNNSVKFYGSTGIQTRIGTDVDLIGFAWQYRWGKGL